MREILRTEELDLNCGGARQTPAGEWEVEAFTSPETAQRLQKAGHRVEIDEKFEDRAAARRSEVGRGDRFQKGRTRPRGLGKKE
ncbi:MAG: hypothetical protein WD696_19750 [Bryobacteraceae bacterium]